MRKSLIIGFLAFFIALIFSKNTFAEEKNIYISRVYATDSKEFVELLTAAKIINLKKFRLKIIKNKLKLRKFKMEFLNRKNI